MDLKAWLQELIRRQPRFRGGGTLLRRADVIARWRLHELDRAWTATSLAADASSLDRFEAWRGRKGPTAATPEEVAGFLRAEITRGLTRPQVSQHRRALSRAHRATGLADPTTHALVQEVEREAPIALDAHAGTIARWRLDQQGLEDTTIYSYAVMLGQFERFCASRGLAACPASARSIVAYAHHLMALRKKNPREQVKRALAAIRSAHLFAGFPDPTSEDEVARTMRIRPTVMAMHIEDPALWRPVLARWRLDQVCLAPARAVTVGRHLERFERFCAERGVQPDAADAAMVVQFLRQALAAYPTRARVREVKDALALGFTAAGLGNPCADPAVNEELVRLVSADVDPLEVIGLKPPALPGTGEPMSEELEIADAIARKLMAQAEAPKTRQLRLRWLLRYMEFCTRHDLKPVPARVTTVERFFGLWAAKLSPVSLEAARSAIAWLHKRMGCLISPTESLAIEELMAGHRNSWPTATKKARSLTAEEMRKICAAMDEEGSVLAMRDKAEHLLAFAAALRVSEGTTRRGHDDDHEWFLAIRDILFTPDGLTVLIRRSKTDRTPNIEKVHVTWGKHPETCPVIATRAWIDYLQSQGFAPEDPLFPAIHVSGDPVLGRVRIYRRAHCRDQANRNLIKWAERAGVSTVGLSTHSRRRGHATEARRNGADFIQIKRQGRWKSTSTVLEYIDEVDAARQSSSQYLEL